METAFPVNGQIQNVRLRMQSSRFGFQGRDAQFDLQSLQSQAHDPSPEARNSTERVREAVEKLISAALIQPLFSRIQSSPFRTDLLHGGYGEKVFAARLHRTLADRISHRMGLSITDAIVDRMTTAASHPTQGTKVDQHG